MLVQPPYLELQHLLLQRLAEARVESDAVFDLVKPEALYDRPIAERHRIIFYIGHLEAFDWNLLRERVIDRPALHSEFDRLFAFGIDPIGGGLPTDQPSDWPSVREVRQYVDEVRSQIDRGMERALSDGGSQEFAPSLLLNVAIEHRLMHAETLAYMLHQLPLERKIRPARSPEVAAHPVMPEMIEVPAGSVTLGLRREDPSAFGWDNEFEQHTVEVPAFAIDKYMVTNSQYGQFIEAGGYQEQSLWPEAGWTWITKNGITHPGFWRRHDGIWFLRTMFDEIPLPSDWPVYVSHAEATAYARWAGKSLPAEAQWQRSAYGTPDGGQRLYPWGEQVPGPRHGNFDFQRWDPVPVGTFAACRSAFGAVEMLGNGWEWTSSPFAPFPGFQPFSFYKGYSADFFDNRHYVMKGGSARTAACMLRSSFRNWFQPHYPHVYAGFRCVSQ